MLPLSGVKSFWSSSKTTNHCPLEKVSANLKNRSPSTEPSKGVLERPVSGGYNYIPPSAPTKPASVTPAPTNADASTSFLKPIISYKDDPGCDILVTEFPGLTKNDLKVQVDEGYVCVWGEKKINEKKLGETKNWDLVGWNTKKCLLRVKLPENSDPDTVDAKWNNNALTVTIPKIPTMERVYSAS